MLALLVLCTSLAASAGRDLEALAPRGPGTSAGPQAPGDGRLPPIESLQIHIEGAGATRPGAVLRLMSTRVGATFDAGTLAGDLDRLRSLGILYDLSASAADGGRRIEVTVKDRWSLLPVFGLRRGGGRTTARFGATDHNALGQLMTLYAELSSNATIPFSDGRFGSYVYAEVPRVFGTRFRTALYWTRDFIDYAAFDANGVHGYLYDRSRHDLRFDLRYELTDLLSLSFGGDFLHDRASTSSASRGPGSPPPPVDDAAAVIGLQLGVVQNLLSQSSGQDLSLQVSGSRAGVLGTSGGAVSFGAVARGYFLPAPRHNTCVQLALQGTTGRSDSYLFRAGGLREIRGFSDGTFSGQLLLRGNLEHRVDLFRLNLVVPAVVQAAAFTDAGYVKGRADAVAGMTYEGPILGTGAGMRWIPVPFASVVGRIDLAMGLVPRRTFDLSLSGQQFF